MRVLNILSETVFIRGPVLAAVAAMGAIVGIDLARDFDAWWAETTTPEDRTGAGSLWSTTDPKTGAPLHVSFTVFYSFDYQGLQIVTGHKYQTDWREADEEYCYAARTTLFSNETDVLNLGGKLRGGAAQFTDITGREVSSFGVSASQMMNLAELHCQFSSPSEAPADDPETSQNEGEQDV